MGRSPLYNVRVSYFTVVSSPTSPLPTGPPHLSDSLQAIIPFDWRFSCADRGVLPAMIPLILPRLPDYQDFGVPTSAFLILAWLPLPFSYHDFDVRGPRSMCKREHWINAPRCRCKVSTQSSPMTIIKPTKLPVQGKSTRAPVALHKPADSASRKSSRVPRPSFKVVDSLTSLSSSSSSSRPSSKPSLEAADSFTSLSSSPRPLLKAADSLASLSSSSSRPPLKASDSLASLSSATSPQSLRYVSLGLDGESRASSPESPGHITVTDSEEVDPQTELGTRIVLLSSFFY